jgi:3-oxoacyl-[acyl-carrier protein] reductase
VDLEKAAVLVTGGSCGIGFETARLLRERGARVAICARHEESLNAAAEQLGAIPILGDVSREDDVTRMIREVIKEFDDYNVLINNAGFGAFAPLVELASEELLKVWQTNVLGVMLCGRESARHFIGHGYGNIVNVSSTAGLRGMANGTAYCSSKFAVGAMTECWRAELRQHNIRVMQVNPSEVQTNFGAGGRSQSTSREQNPTKLTASDIGQLIVDMLEIPDRGFVTDTTIWATNPKAN